MRCDVMFVMWRDWQWVLDGFRMRHGNCAPLSSECRIVHSKCIVVDC